MMILWAYVRVYVCYFRERKKKKLKKKRGGTSILKLKKYYIKVAKRQTNYYKMTYLL